jgi:hypothetical protein
VSDGAHRALFLLLACVALPPAVPRAEDAVARDAETGVVQALQGCRREVDDAKRLACFDAVARSNAPPRWSGRLGLRTPSFEIDRPHLLRFRSKGVIFVLYVIDANGAVIQNLHIGGGGEDTYTIEKPGTYSLQIDGSETWQIWLDPA